QVIKDKGNIQVEKEQAKKFFYSEFYTHVFEDYLKENKEDIRKKYEKYVGEKVPKGKEKDEWIITKLQRFNDFLRYGAGEYRRLEMSATGNDEEKLKKAERHYIYLIAEIFEVIMKEEFSTNVLVENSEIDIEKSEEKIKRILSEKIKPIEINKLSLFSYSIYSSTRLSSINVKNQILQNINRFLVLYQSLKKREERLDTKCFSNIFKKVVENKNIEYENLIDELAKVKEKIAEDIKLYNFKNLISTDNFFAQEDFKTSMLNYLNFNIEESSKYKTLDEITYKKQNKDRENIDVQIWNQGKTGSDRNDLIIQSTFISDEYRNKSLKYDFEVHNHALEAIGMNYPKCIQKYEKYQKIIEEDNSIYKDYEGMSCSEEIDGFGEITIIQYYMKVKENIYSNIRNNQTSDPTIKKLLINVIQEVNEYNFYKNIVSMQQLKKNKLFYEENFKRFFAWVTQAETFGAIVCQLENSEYNAKNGKKRYLSRAEKIADELREEKNKKTSPINFEKFRNSIAHANIYQMNRYTKAVKCEKSLNDIWGEFLEFNRYSLKKWKEVWKVNEKILDKFSVEIKDKKSREQFVPKMKRISKVCGNSRFSCDVPLISEVEAKYLYDIYTYNRSNTISKSIGYQL
ncbi:MAG: hypothetical protein ACRC0V_08540, partial [Fusobacteriaceae bacterium]